MNFSLKLLIKKIKKLLASLMDFSGEIIDKLIGSIAHLVALPGMLLKFISSKGKNHISKAKKSKNDKK